MCTYMECDHIGSSTDGEVSTSQLIWDPPLSPKEGLGKSRVSSVRLLEIAFCCQRDPKPQILCLQPPGIGVHAFMGANATAAWASCHQCRKRASGDMRSRAEVVQLESSETEDEPLKRCMVTNIVKKFNLT